MVNQAGKGRGNCRKTKINEKKKKKAHASGREHVTSNKYANGNAKADEVNMDEKRCGNIKE